MWQDDNIANHCRSGTADAGSVWLDGREVTGLEPNQRDVNTVFQNYALFPHMNVAENIAMA